jgi:hypothetical protein
MIVAESQPISPYALLGRLRDDFGASHSDANRTMLELLRDGRLKSGFSGLTLPGGSTSAGGGNHALGIIAAVLGIVASLLTIWEVGARTDLFPVSGPLEQVQALFSQSQSPSAKVVVPDVRGQLAANAFARISQAGLQPEGEFEDSSSVELGRVIRTDPPGGVPVARDSVVVIVTSTGD